MEDLGEEVEKPVEPPPSSGPGTLSRPVPEDEASNSVEPIPVIIEPPELTPLQIAETITSGLSRDHP